MGNVNNSGDAGASREITPKERAMYEQEYKHGADLFQRALQQHVKSNDMYQKSEFQDVMDNMMQVMNETAKALKQNHLKEQNKQIAKDYAAYQDSPDPATEKKLSKDLDQAKKSI